MQLCGQLCSNPFSWQNHISSLWLTSFLAVHNALVSEIYNTKCLYPLKVHFIEVVSVNELLGTFLSSLPVCYLLVFLTVSRHQLQKHSYCFGVSKMILLSFTKQLCQAALNFYAKDDVAEVESSWNVCKQIFE